ncbi:MAG: hypothetical protein EHM59_06850 [Betaproteobacteria bacterium]|nr:MAG: hypothetical protein EHM59_06850 [Betaproteobacteria bacterium]
MATKLPFHIPVRVSAELLELIRSLLESQPSNAAITLREVRRAAQEDRFVRLEEGELSHPQDRTALLIEIDVLISEHGEEMPAAVFLHAPPA